MDLIDHLQGLATKVSNLREHLQTEEATKNAIILPFITALGYDVFNPLEVIPEFTSDYGIKKGEKVDYAIMRDGKPIMLFECKKCGDKLAINTASQLSRYFHYTDARIAVLTDGILYQFYTDLDAPNVMDMKPFMEIDILNLQESLVPELKKLTRTSFNLEDSLQSASELKYMKGMRQALAEEFDSPSPDFVRFLTAKVHSGTFTQAVKLKFTDISRRAFQLFINDRVNDRIKVALAGNQQTAQPVGFTETTASIEETTQTDSRIETTPEELEGYYIVKSILRKTTDLTRIAHRDAISYFSILLDDNNRKPICRLYFNRVQKYIGLFDEMKEEQRFPVNSLDDLYQHADRLRSTVKLYDAPNAKPESSNDEIQPAIEQA